MKFNRLKRVLMRMALVYFIFCTVMMVSSFVIGVYFEDCLLVNKLADLGFLKITEPSLQDKEDCFFASRTIEYSSNTFFATTYYSFFFLLFILTPIFVINDIRDSEKVMAREVEVENVFPLQGCTCAVRWTCENVNKDVCYPIPRKKEEFIRCNHYKERRINDNTRSNNR